jgi:hypothetical protein
MQSAVGVIHTVEDAKRVAREVMRATPSARIRILTPDTTPEALSSVPTDESEQPGMGSAIGAVVGGAAGAGAASLLFPPAGAIALVGIAAGALIGGIGGASAGGAMEESAAFGLPKDEWFVYAGALEHGRCVVVAYVEADAELDEARRAMDAAGADTVDAARDAWWVGLRDTEAGAYGDTARFATDEPLYREGFEWACHGEDAVSLAGDRSGHPAFQAGYTRGRAYVEERTREIAVTRPAIVDEGGDAAMLRPS